MVKVGLIVNPVAGMGGSVGLKGTDGEMYARALALGAKPVAAERLREVLSLVERSDIIFLAARGRMGEDYLKDFDFEYEAVGCIGESTDSNDTKKIAVEMASMGAELVIFVGGDGTARDIMDALGTDTPVIGIPSGVKMFSPVFALSAHAAAGMINLFSDRFIEKEVLDIDEDAFRDNRLVSKLYGYARVPDISRLLQGKKEGSNVSSSAEDKKMEMAEYIVQGMEADTVYILGPGTTLKAIADRLGVEKTLLGIDAVLNGRLIGVDINEKGILEIIMGHGKSKIIVTPIGGNGFIFGRGSKQISSDVLKLIRREDIIIVGTMDKVAGLECLRVDTGDYLLDKELSGRMNVIVGYNEEVAMEVKCD